MKILAVDEYMAKECGFKDEKPESELLDNQNNLQKSIEKVLNEDMPSEV
jgi:hypothetical protein